MSLLQDQHELFAKFFTTPTREALRELLRQSIGETDYLDFKELWPETSKLARHVLALANSGGGAIVVGVKQAEDGKLVAIGVPVLKDKAQLIPPLSAYVPKTVQLQVLDFTYAASEYTVLVGKAFQVLLVADDPKNMPFLALKDADGLRRNAIYVRSGTRSTEAEQAELQIVLNRRIESGYSSRPVMELESHMTQLRVLDERRPSSDCLLNQHINDQMSVFDDESSSDYRRFLEEAYEAKKEQVLRLLGLPPQVRAIPE